MLGTVVNALGIIVFSFLGLFVKINEKYEKAVKDSLGIAVFFLGASGAVSGLMNEEANILLFISSLIIGTIIGVRLKIDYHFQRFGDYLGSKFGSSGTFAKGFVTASYIYCIGAMAIIGSFESGLTGNHTVLYAKTILDSVMSFILASTMGIGVLFSAVSVVIYQGSLTLLSGLLSPLITDSAIRELSTVGNVLIVAIGLEMMQIKKINYANMLPAIFIPIIFYLPKLQEAIASILKLF